MSSKATNSQRIYEPNSSQMSKDAVRAQTLRLDEAYRLSRGKDVYPGLSTDPSILLYQALNLAA